MIGEQRDHISALFCCLSLSYYILLLNESETKNPKTFDHIEKAYESNPRNVYACPTSILKGTKPDWQNPANFLIQTKRSKTSQRFYQLNRERMTDITESQLRPFLCKAKYRILVDLTIVKIDLPFIFKVNL